MSISHVVDAHALIWYLESNAKLGGAAKQFLTIRQAISSCL